MLPLITHKTHPHLFYTLGTDQDERFYLRKHDLDLSLFEGSNALSLNAQVNNWENNQVSSRYIFPCALYNCLSGTNEKVKFHPKKDKDKILNYIDKAHSEAPNSLK